MLHLCISIREKQKTEKFGLLTPKTQLILLKMTFLYFLFLKESNARHFK